MTFELKVPTTGESITEVEIGDWLKAEGEAVGRDEAIVVIETDKATVDLPCPEAGTLAKIVKATGERVAVGEVIALIEVGGQAVVGKTVPAPVEVPRSAPEPSAADRPATAPAPTPPAQRVVMPAAARVLAQAKLSAEQVPATGPGGRVLKEDAERAAVTAQAAPEVPATGPRAAPPAAPSVEAPAAGPSPAPSPAAPASSLRPAVPAVPATGRRDEVVRMSLMRRRIAEKLVAAQNQAALLTTFNEIDMSAVMALRKARGEAFLAQHGVKLGFMSFFVKAVVDALKRIPQVNGEIRGEDLVFHNYYDIGVAVGGGKGLVVPVLRNADRLSFAEIEKAIEDFGARARANRLDLPEIQGGTFTISNGGVYGSLMSTPIVNPPQSGVLGLHAIQDRPVARDGQVVIRPMMYVALTYDHRMVDGREAVTFLKRIKEAIEDPARMLVEV